MQLENDQDLDQLQWTWEGNLEKGRLFLAVVLRKAWELGEGGILLEWSNTLSCWESTDHPSLKAHNSEIGFIIPI